MKINTLWNKEDKIAIALSGGVDSIVLFHLLVTEYKDSYKELVVFHINHGLREESYEEAGFVEKFVKDFDVKFYKEELNMSDLERDSHTSEEMLARELRYQAFNKMAKLEGVTKLLTAHHKNDQVENILMRLLTGRSIDHSLAICEEIEMAGLNIYRPLLNSLKAELEEYAKEKNLHYYVDATNFDTDYTRNNIRHNIVPLLNDINSGSFDNLINFANYYQNINNNLKKTILSKKDNYIFSRDKDKISLVKDKFLELNEEEMYFLLKDLITDELGVFDVKQKAIFDVVSSLKKNTGNKSYDLKNNLKIISQYETLYIHKIEKKCYNEKIEIIIDKICENSVYEFYQNKFIISTDAKDSEIGFNKSELPLLITTKKEGDRVRRGEINKKLSRIFIDEKIPKELRDTLPVIRNNKGEVLGVLGIGTKVNKNKIYDYYIKMKG
ncbi:tRNA(Ile)-lysidine synthetase [Gemella sanguinis M325]|uniref:tRNA(Ile)-lysidine synthase n=1 Tax=Gemella sanguinis TaxID=84135 RepID=A0ABX6FH88_9BACL|nr:tRNA lysidine(34) synthetase TilS [Gemella sanguinis]EGF88719.1 tRNA(Ile)-lysidine synthetase [Gemella sanguinis M325]QGS07460.1 tRNA lysidine(34) synthetase TilS [Gemella sanguinis]